MSVISTPDVLEINGRFERGRIVLDTPPALPEGTRLHVRILVEKPQAPESGNKKERLEQLLALAGSCPDFPTMEEIRGPWK